MTPAFKNHPAIKRLSFRRNDQAIVFAPCVPVRVTPVKFDRLEFQRVQRKKQVLAPVIAVPALPRLDQLSVTAPRAGSPILRPWQRPLLALRNLAVAVQH